MIRVDKYTNFDRGSDPKQDYYIKKDTHQISVSRAELEKLSTDLVLLGIIDFDELKKKLPLDCPDEKLFMDEFMLEYALSHGFKGFREMYEKLSGEELHQKYREFFQLYLNKLTQKDLEQPEQLVCSRCIEGLKNSNSFKEGVCIHCKKELY